jgi:hypothetical protein
MKRIFHALKGFVYASAGVDTQLIYDCPLHERRRNLYIGLLVLLVSSLSFISVVYTVYSIFDASIIDRKYSDFLNLTISLIIGFIWFLVVFNIYRACLTISGIGDGTSRITKAEVLNALPQFFMAFVLALSLGAPLNILLLHREVNHVVTASDIDRLMLNEESQIKSQVRELVESHMDKESSSGASLNESKVFRDLKENQDELLEQSSQSFMGLLEKIFHQYPYLTALIFLVAIHLYVVPIFLRMLWVKGVYEFKVEFQNQISLENNGIFLDYYRVNYQGTHTENRFIQAEKVMRSRKFFTQTSESTETKEQQIQLSR